MRIIADTATLYSPAEGEAMGLTVVPVCVTINDRTFRDYVEITGAELLEMIGAGGVPKTSQPSVGDVLELFEAEPGEILMLTVGEGLSGAYQMAMGAKNSVENNERIHILNSGTLAGPLRYLARKAVALREQGLDIERIKAELQQRIETSMSFVIPADFEFLKRSGRLTPLAAKIGGALKLLPVLTQTKDRTRITPVNVKRTWKSAVESIIQRMQADHVDENYLISVSHAGTVDRAMSVMQQIRAKFEKVEMELLELSPALMTHGGPGCIVVQAIQK